MNILRPFRRKNRKPDTARRAYVRSLPCAICVLLGMRQRTRSECAHVGPRGLGTKCPDSQTIPLCNWHHTKGPGSHHRLQKEFWTRYRIDRDELIAEVTRGFEERREAA